MRVEDVGSFSVSGDLLAFSIAIILTLSVLSMLAERRGTINPEEDDTVERLLRDLAGWELLDVDDDGFLEAPAGNLSFGVFPFDYEGSFIVRFRSERFHINFTMDDGNFRSEEGGYEICSPVISITVLYENADEVLPGTISAAETEAVR